MNNWAEWLSQETSAFFSIQVCQQYFSVVTTIKWKNHLHLYSFCMIYLATLLIAQAVLNRRMINEWWIGKMCEEEVVVYLQVVSQCLPGGPEESHNLNQDSQCHDQDSNWALSEYKSGALPLEPTYSVVFN